MAADSGVDETLAALSAALPSPVSDAELDAQLEALDAELAADERARFARVSATEPDAQTVVQRFKRYVQLRDAKEDHEKRVLCTEIARLRALLPASESSAAEAPAEPQQPSLQARLAALKGSAPSSSGSNPSSAVDSLVDAGADALAPLHKLAEIETPVQPAALRQALAPALAWYLALRGAGGGAK